MNNLLLEFDKAGAEWVVVAYYCGDPNMLSIVESGRSPHPATGSLITGLPEEIVIKEDKLVGKISDPDEVARLRAAMAEELAYAKFLPRSMSIRQAGKKSNHGLNYGMKYRRFALENEIPETDAEQMVRLYTTAAYPGIPENFWKPVAEQMRKDRTLTNCFGHKVRLLGEWGPDLLNQAYSFIPQSTVGRMVNNAIIAAYDDTSPVFEKMDLLTQTHDSATVQYPTDNWEDMAEFVVRFADYMNPELEYSGRKFHIGTDLKIGYEWGEGSMISVKLEEDVKWMAEALKNYASLAVNRQSSNIIVD